MLILEELYAISKFGYQSEMHLVNFIAYQLWRISS